MTLLMLSCSNGYCQSDSSTGGLDSIYISIDDVKKLNIKLLDYECVKEELVLYKELYNNDEIIIQELNEKYNLYVKKNKTIKTIGAYSVLVILVLILM